MNQTTTTNLPFLRTSSSASTKRNNNIINKSSSSPRTQAFQLMNGLKNASKLEQLHDSAMEKYNRGHINQNSLINTSIQQQQSDNNVQTHHHHSHHRPSPSMIKQLGNGTSKSQRELLLSFQLSGAPPKATTTPRPPSQSQEQRQQRQNSSYNNGNFHQFDNNNYKNKQSDVNVDDRRPLRRDGAHIWWPEQFDAIAFNEQLEQLTTTCANTISSSFSKKKSKYFCRMFAVLLRSPSI